MLRALAWRALTILGREVAPFTGVSALEARVAALENGRPARAPGQRRPRAGTPDLMGQFTEARR